MIQQTFKMSMMKLINKSTYNQNILKIHFSFTTTKVLIDGNKIPNTCIDTAVCLGTISIYNVLLKPVELSQTIFEPKKIKLAFSITYS